MTFSRVLCAATMAVLVAIPAAKAQFGEMPGVGGPPGGPPPACQQLSVLRGEYEKPESPIPAHDPYFLGPDFERGGGRGRPGGSR